MNQQAVVAVDEYNRINGRQAGQEGTKRLTLGAPTKAENQAMPIAAQLWQAGSDGTLEMSAELPIHQVMDLMIFLSRTMLHMREAYRFPLGYDPAQPILDRIGLQGDAMQVSICAQSPTIDADMKQFSRAMSDLDELTGERMRVLSRLLQEWADY